MKRRELMLQPWIGLLGLASVRPHCLAGRQASK